VPVPVPVPVPDLPLQSFLQAIAPLRLLRSASILHRSWVPGFDAEG